MRDGQGLGEVANRVAAFDQATSKTDLLTVFSIVLESHQQLLHSKFLLLPGVKGQALEIEQVPVSAQNSAHHPGFRQAFLVRSRPILSNLYRLAGSPVVPELDRPL